VVDNGVPSHSRYIRRSDDRKVMHHLVSPVGSDLFASASGRFKVTLNSCRAEESVTMIKKHFGIPTRVKKYKKSVRLDSNNTLRVRASGGGVRYFDCLYYKNER
jgi:hypothetical protein